MLVRGGLKRVAITARARRRAASWQLYPDRRFGRLHSADCPAAADFSCMLREPAELHRLFAQSTQRSQRATSTVHTQRRRCGRRRCRRRCRSRCRRRCCRVRLVTAPRHRGAGHYSRRRSRWADIRTSVNTRRQPKDTYAPTVLHTTTAPFACALSPQRRRPLHTNSAVSATETATPLKLGCFRNGDGHSAHACALPPHRLIHVKL